MAEVYPDATLDPSKERLVEGWIGAQRWYAAKGGQPRIVTQHAFRFDDPARRVGIETLVVTDDSGASPVVYQVPLTYRGSPVPELEHALVGTMDHSVLGDRWIYDGCHDPAYAERLLAIIQGQDRVASSSASDAFDEGVVGHRHPSWTRDATFGGSRVLRGEQSNTSVIIDCLLPDGTPKPLICKVFRMLQPGANPDVEVQGALREAGCDRVPGVAGHLSGSWDTPDGGTFSGDLVFAQEFLPEVEDAWRVALRAVSRGADFVAEARELGAATAEVHGVLAEALGAQEATATDRTRIVAEMRSRHAAAVTEAPGLAAHDQRVAQIHTAVEGAPWPPMQRIHGDYHLGQVLRSPTLGWVLLDFEGEPLRPLTERARPDQWIRDVAGMLRSFDYAGGTEERARPGRSARAWVESCRQAFLDGYTERSGTDPRAMPGLLTAFELDKAFYEVVYEARNRPTWLSIPLDAARRLLDGDAPVPPGPSPEAGPSQEVTP